MTSQSQPSAPVRLHLVVNPSSGRGRAGRKLPQVVRRLERLHGTGLVVHRTTSYQHSQEVAAAAVAEDGVGGVRTRLLVMGGDGMAHLGLNACAGTQVPLGVIPAGTGNDFVRGAGLATTVEAATSAVVTGRTRAMDLMRVTRPDGSHEWVGSVLSTGYDARVNRGTNALDHRVAAFGGLAYAGVALAELATFTPLRYRLVLDGRPRELDSVLVAVANAGYFGGGMHICPTASVTDGLLDVLLVHDLSRAAVLRLLPRLYLGAHLGHPAVELVRARTVQVDGQGLRSGQTMFAMGDGEELGDVPLLAQCVPGALQVVTPA